MYLRGITNQQEALLSQQLETNIVSFLQWGFLEIGSFYDVRIPSSGAYGGNQHILRLSENKSYAKGRIWEGFRKDWVWETGVPYIRQPVRVSGIYVNGGFHSISSTGTYAHNVDYPNGRIIFNSAIPASSVVSCEYSYRYFSFTNDVPWIRKAQTNSFRIDNNQFTQYGSGDYSNNSQNRIQLPAVIVEATTKTDRFGKQLGSLQAMTYQDVEFHILAETRSDVQFMHDALTYQYQNDIPCFDKNVVYQSGDFPLTKFGYIASGCKTHPQLVNLYKFDKNVRINKVRSIQKNIDAIDMPYYSVVTATIEVDSV